MLYHFLRFVILLMLRAFFGSIRLKGLEQVPRRGGLILAANHPSTFLDPLVVAAWLRRPVFFLANGGIFTSPLVKWLLRQLFMIPIYRKHDSAQAASKNQDSFSACYDLLRQGGCLVIFPEGSSEDERRLRPIKTGTARIALGAQAGQAQDLGIHLVCVGINYTNPRKFQSRLQVQYDLPLPTGAYAGAYAADPVQAVQALTNEIASRLSAMIVHTANDEVDDLVRDIEQVYSTQLKAEQDLQAPETEQVFMVARQIAEAVHHFEATQPERVDGLQAQLKAYLGQLKTLGATDQLVAQFAEADQLRAGKLGDWLTLLAGFPLYLYSELHNFLPYRIPGWAALRFVRDVVFRAPINLVLGLVTFCLFYPLYWWVFRQLVPTPWWAVGLYAISLPLSGYFAFVYYHFGRRKLQQWRFARQVAAQPGLLAGLRATRADILRVLAQAKAEYLASLPKAS
jgi:glycerol-3-phosphate O-acyltransferase / dihydroxyacetone phosphate acyltransferase